MIHTYQVLHPDVDMSDVYMLASTVSSKILASMAKKEGFNFEVYTFNIYNKIKKKILVYLKFSEKYFIFLDRKL